MSGTTVGSRADLDAEGDRIGAEFGLGQRAGVWMARQLSARVAWAVIILIAVASGGFLLPVSLTGFGRGISAVLESDLVVSAVAAMMLPPRSRTDRLYLYAGGIALQAAREAEPTVLRWAELESMTLTTGSGDEGDYISACRLRDRAGRTMTVRRAFGAGTEETIATAERILAPGLVPELIGRYDAGEPTMVGRLTVDQAGITCEATSSATGTSSAAASSQAVPQWRIPWAQARSIDIRMHGQRVRVTRRKRGSGQAAMDGVPNGFAVRYLIEHAARQAGIAVATDDAGWDGETAYGAEAAEAAQAAQAAADLETLPALRAGPDERHPGRWRRRLVTVAIAVLAIEGAVIGYLFATRPYPPVVTAIPGDVTPVSGGTDSVDFTPDRQSLIFTDGDSELVQTIISSGQSTTFNPGGYPYEWGAVVSPDGQTVAAIDGGSQVDLWNAATHAASGSVQPSAGPAGASLEALAYSPDGRWLAAADRYGNIYLWDTATGAQRVLTGPVLAPGEIQTVAFSPDDTTIALGDSSGAITLWDAATGAARGTLTDPGQQQFLGQPSSATGVVSLSFASRGSLLAAADGNGNLYLWDTGDHSLAATLSGDDPVTATALNPAGTLVAGGTSGGETYLWDVATQQQVAVLGSGSGGGGSAVAAVAFSQDGSQVAIGGKSVITVWSITAHGQG